MQGWTGHQDSRELESSLCLPILQLEKLGPGEAWLESSGEWEAVPKSGYHVCPGSGCCVDFHVDGHEGCDFQHRTGVLCSRRGSQVRLADFYGDWGISVGHCSLSRDEALLSHTLPCGQGTALDGFILFPYFQTLTLPKIRKSEIRCQHGWVLARTLVRSCRGRLLIVSSSGEERKFWCLYLSAYLIPPHPRDHLNLPKTPSPRTTTRAQLWGAQFSP